MQAQLATLIATVSAITPWSPTSFFTIFIQLENRLRWLQAEPRLSKLKLRLYHFTHCNGWLLVPMRPVQIVDTWCSISHFFVLANKSLSRPWESNTRTNMKYFGTCCRPWKQMGMGRQESINYQWHVTYDRSPKALTSSIIWLTHEHCHGTLFKQFNGYTT
jgi:hypothetical protein